MAYTQALFNGSSTICTTLQSALSESAHPLYLLIIQSFLCMVQCTNPSVFPQMSSQISTPLPSPSSPPSDCLLARPRVPPDGPQPSWPAPSSPGWPPTLPAPGPWPPGPPRQGHPWKPWPDPEACLGRILGPDDLTRALKSPAAGSPQFQGGGAPKSPTAGNLPTWESNGQEPQSSLARPALAFLRSSWGANFHFGAVWVVVELG